MLNIWFLLGAFIGAFLLTMLVSLFYKKYDAKQRNLYSVLTAYPIMVFLYNMGAADDGGFILARFLASMIAYGIACLGVYVIRSLIFKDN